MATLKIWKSDIEDDRLPPVCVVCGADADRTKTVNFSWTPSWIFVLWLIGLLPAIIGYLLTNKKMKVPLPVCERHQSHWQIGWVIVGSAIAVAIGLGCLGFYVQSSWDKSVGENIWMCSVGLLVLTGLTVFLFGDRGVHAEEITDQTITLKGVSDQFVKAMESVPEVTVPAKGVALQTAKYFGGGYGRERGY